MQTSRVSAYDRGSQRLPQASVLLFSFGGKGSMAMLISIHIPVVDLRNFLEVPTGKLELPRWASPDLQRDFIRSFGGFGGCVQAGSNTWVDEYKFCRANNLIKFNKFDKSVSDKPRCAFRSFFSDGRVLGRFDVGFTYRIPDKGISGPELMRIIDDVLSFKVSVYIDGEVRAGRLREAGPGLARAYLAASTSHFAQSKPNPLWVESAQPILVIQYNEQEKVILPPSTRRAGSLSWPNIDLSYGSRSNIGGYIGVWFIGALSACMRLRSREMRVELVRLHTEKQCLHMVLRSIAMGRIAPRPRSFVSTAVQNYINETSRHIGRLENKISTDTADMIRMATVEIAPGELESLAQELECQFERMDMRPNIRSKILRNLRGSRSPDQSRTTSCQNKGILKEPTRAEARKLIEVFLQTDPEFDAFCIDHYPDIKRRFTIGMDRVTKDNLLVELAPTQELFEKLILFCSEQKRQYDKQISDDKSIKNLL